MTAKKKVSGPIPVVITTGALRISAEPIDMIVESRPIHSVEIDITSIAMLEVRPSADFVIGVSAPNHKTVEKALGRLIGGIGFMYELTEDRVVKGLYDLRVISGIGPLHIMSFAEAFQAVSRHIQVYVGGSPVAAL